MDTPDEENTLERSVTAKPVASQELSEARENASTSTEDLKSEMRLQPASPATKELPATIHQFISTASNEMLGGICIGLVVCIYLVLGRLGLVLIGVAGGIILHAAWEDDILISEIRNFRREKGLDIVSRALDWREDQAKIRIKSELEQVDELMVTGSDFEGLPTEIGAALNALVETAINNYVKWWYCPIIPADDSFPAACRHTMTAFLRSISNHLSRKRPADAFLDILTNSSSIFIVFLNELSKAIGASQSAGDSTADAIHIYLSSKPESSLAILMDRYQQRKKFKMVADDILQNFLERPVYECIQTRIFLKEMLASVVLEMSLSACSKPEWINGWIVYLLEDGESEVNHTINDDMGSMSSNDLEVDLETTKFTESIRTEKRKHQKRLSKAEEAMEEAMREAKRLSQLIAESEERRVESLETSITSDESSRQTNDSLVAGELQRSKLQSTNNHSDGETLHTSTQEVKPEKELVSSFMSFDQIVPPVHVATLKPKPRRPRKQTTSLSLFNANIIIHDDFTANDKGRIGGKPTTDYLIQIEPESSQYPGWMTVRRYPDFEALHEVLWRIAKIAGVETFTEQHKILPSWKTHTRPSLRGELERYLRDACWQQPLADCEGMKHFLEKNQSNMQTSSTKGISWPTPAAFENMGKGVLDVLSSAPKGAAGGSKAVLGGVTGVLGNISSLGQKKRVILNNNNLHTARKSSMPTPPRLESTNSFNLAPLSTENEANRRLLSIIHNQTKVAPLEPKPSNTTSVENGSEGKDQTVSLSRSSSSSGQDNTCASRDPGQTSFARINQSTPTQAIEMESDISQLPPGGFSDGYTSPTGDSIPGHSRKDFLESTIGTSTSNASTMQLPSSLLPSTSSAPPKKPRKATAPITEQETRVAIELLFASISELYTLSSAWKFRRTLLMAAKAFLLRPGNPSLASIQALIQDSIIAPNVSDSGIATHLHKLRGNSMPTEEERKTWLPEMTASEKETLRIKARKLLVEKGLPNALTGVMGQVATSEALGRLFDCLQIEEVARGLMFGLLLQGIQGMAH
jgi:hypothetical protein